jgi:hypothetical protein
MGVLYLVRGSKLIFLYTYIRHGLRSGSLPVTTILKQRSLETSILDLPVILSAKTTEPVLDDANVLLISSDYNLYARFLFMISLPDCGVLEIYGWIAVELKQDSVTSSIILEILLS